MHLYYMYMYMYNEMYNLSQGTTTHGFTCVLGQIKPFCDQLDMYTCHVKSDTKKMSTVLTVWFTLLFDLLWSSCNGAKMLVNSNRLFFYSLMHYQFWFRGQEHVHMLTQMRLDLHYLVWIGWIAMLLRIQLNQWRVYGTRYYGNDKGIGDGDHHWERWLVGVWGPEST